MKAKERNQKNYFEIVNINKETNEITMLDYIFRHSDGFKGATGIEFEPVSKEEYKDRMSKDSVIDSIIDSGLIEYSYNKEIQRKMAAVLYQEMKRAGELEGFCFDLSYTEHWDKIRVFGYPKSKYPIFNCTGGGRCFDKDFKGNINPKLSKLIRDIES